jgi:hypothetical protein
VTDTAVAIPGRFFDPQKVGSLECSAWVAYYRRDWLAFLRLAVSLSHDTARLSWPATVRGAWLALRATRLWAPVPNNDPDGARRAMEGFYRLVKRRHNEAFDPATAARLEIEWWRVHRECQYAEGDPDERSLVEALVSLYTCLFGTSPQSVRAVAEERAVAMRYSDRWVSDGCFLESPLIDQQRDALIRSYTGLLAVVDNPRRG